VIAGARGETEEEWLKGLEFISSLPVQQLHVFPYSERPGTKALDIDEVVSQADKHRRVEALMALSDKKYNEFVRQMLGSEMPVLWEQPHLTNHDGTPADPNEIMMHGFTPNYLRVEAPYHPELINHITTARLISPIDHETVSGSLL
jgi:threonylcarbamoyladenosine tRNA methylthiotransferase MtaB